jgi:hypothetical protein
MKRLVATLLCVSVVVGVANAAHADEPLPAPPVVPPASDLASPVLPVAPPVGISPAAVVVEPLPPPAPAGAAPLVAGVMTAFIPFVVGCGLWSSTDGGLEKAGTYAMASGFALAPWVSHGLQRRWKRAAVFGGIATALSAATLIVMDAYKDPFYAPHANRQRVPFGVLLTSAMFAAGVGLFDSFLAAPASREP